MKRNWMFAFIVALSALAMGQKGFAAPPVSEETQIKSAISVYMGKWIAGDYAGMRKLWDVKSQRLISAKQIVSAFQYTLTAEDIHLLKNIKNPLDSDAIAEMQKKTQTMQFRPRYYLPGNVKMRGKTSAISDLQATFTIDSLMGTPDSFTNQIMLDQAGKTDKDNPNGSVAGSALFLLALVGIEWNYDTALGEYSYVPIKRDKPGSPLLMLRLARYELVKEKGQWKIANAIQSVKKYPEVMEHQTEARQKRTIMLNTAP